jgi:ABC-2 type transport system permease protein
MFAAAVILLSGILGGNFNKEASLLLAAGWLTWTVASDGMAELPQSISDEARTGTLEQLCITPVPLSVILVVRSLVYFLGVGARGILAAAILSFFVAPLSLSPIILFLFLMSLIGAYGLGFLFAGLALIFKRVKALTNLVFSLMIFFTGAFVGLESTGWVFQVLKILFPLTWGISLMRQVVSGSANLTLLIHNGALLWLAIHSIVYLFIGLGLFGWGYWTARKTGTLGHY